MSDMKVIEIWDTERDRLIIGLKVFSNESFDLIVDKDTLVKNESKPDRRTVECIDIKPMRKFHNFLNYCLKEKENSND